MAACSYVGVDLHDASLRVSVRNCNGDEIVNKNIPTKCVGKVSEFFCSCPRPVHCAVESVGMYEWLWDLLEPLQFERLMLADAVELSFRRGRRNAETDRTSARFISQLVFRDEIPQAFVPDKTTREFRRLVRHWHNTTDQLSSLKIRLRWICKQHNLPGPAAVTGASAQKWFLTHGHKLSPMASVTFHQLLCSIEHIEQQRVELRRFLIFFGEKDLFRGDIQIVQTVPGIDLVISSVVIAEVADFRRFHSAEAVRCYSGLTERTKESAGRVAPGHISKAGSPTLRWALGEAVNCLIRHDAHAKKIYARVYRKTSDKSKAKVALARMLIGWLWKMVTSGQPYQSGGPAMKPGEPASQLS